MTTAVKDKFINIDFNIVKKAKGNYSEMQIQIKRRNTGGGDVNVYTLMSATDFTHLPVYQSLFGP